MKKMLLAAVAVLAMTAGAANAGQKKFDGFYAGGQVGGVVSNTQVDGLDLYGDGASIGLFGGYGVTFDKFYVGAEANGYWGDVDTSVGFASLKKDFGFGLGGRLGYLVTPTTLGYGLLGWERARFEVSDLPGEQWVDGLRWGAGVEQAFAENLSVRGELAVVNWDKKDLDGVKAHEVSAKLGVAYRF